MPWPTRQDYFTTIQNPRLAFQDPELRSGQPRLIPKLGLPWGCNGAFATVYRIQTSGRDWAVKCFLNDFADQQQRYRAISEHLTRLNLPYTIGFDFQPRGILVGGQHYPLLKMEWVQGDRLDEYIKTNLNNPDVLALLASNWLKMMAALRKASIAHGDLQHGNILVVKGDFKLIDYDGMFVPSLAGRGSHEVGHSNYQHPSRAASDYGPHLDNFSSWVIYLSFLALRADPQLWQRIQSAGDDRMLFSKDDFENPEFSEALRIIGRASEPQIQTLVSAIRAYARLGDISQIPTLAEFSAEPSIEPPIAHPPSDDWIKGHLQSKSPVRMPRAEESMPMEGGSWIETHLEPLPPLELASSLTSERLASVSLLVATLAALIALATEILNALYGVPSVIAIQTVFWLLLRQRFKKLSEVQNRNRFLAEIKSLETSIEQFADALSEWKQHKATQEALEDSRCNALKEKHRTLEISQRNELSGLQNQMTGQQTRLLAEKKQADARLTQLESDFRAKQRQSEEAERLEKEGNQRALLSKLSDIKSNRLQSQHTEEEAVRQALARLQKEFITKELHWWRLADASIEQIGDRMRQRLAVSGIITAADIPDYWGGIRVDGIGFFRAQRLVDWKKDLESKIRSRAPLSLPSAEEAAIRSPAKAHQKSLDASEQLAKRNAADKERAIESARRSERTALENSLRDAKAQMQRVGKQSEESGRSEQIELQRKRDAASEKWNGEKLAVEQESKKVQEEFQSQRNEIGKQMLEVSSQLSELRWSQNRVKRELTAYRNITFNEYVKVILLPRR